jgi:hypothetical protein
MDPLVFDRPRIHARKGFLNICGANPTVPESLTAASSARAGSENTQVLGSLLRMARGLPYERSLVRLRRLT